MSDNNKIPLLFFFKALFGKTSLSFSPLTPPPLLKYLQLKVGVDRGSAKSLSAVGEEFQMQGDRRRPLD